MPNVAALMREHVSPTGDGVDPIYLDAYVQRPQAEGAQIGFLLHRGQQIASPAVFGQISQAFKTDLRAWSEERDIPWREF